MRVRLILTLALAMSGCGKAPKTIQASGGSFPFPLYFKWFGDYHQTRPDVEVNYQPIGSGGGIRQLMAGTVDFAATDVPMTDAEIARMKVPPMHFPTVLGAVVPSYNVPGADTKLKFTPEALAGIFLGEVRLWNDRLLAEANPEAHLPNRGIVVIHRSDGSGTSFVWTDYLSRVSLQWRARVGAGAAVSWPTGLGAKGNEGVAGMLKSTPNSIGYLELNYALQNGISHGAVRNAAGQFTNADAASVSAAGMNAMASLPEDFRVSITNALGTDSYPLSTFTWLLIPSRIEPAEKREAIVQLLRWIYADGQKSAAGLNYVPLPHELAAKLASRAAEVR